MTGVQTCALPICDNGYHHYDAGFTYISVKDYGSDIGWKVEGSGGFYSGLLLSNLGIYMNDPIFDYIFLRLFLKKIFNSISLFLGRPNRS